MKNLIKTLLVIAFIIPMGEASTVNAQGWFQKGMDIDGEAENDVSGCSVSLSSDGNIVAIGASEWPPAGEEAGHVRIYEWSGTNWIQKGIDIDGEAGGNSGWSVSLSSGGNIVAIGAVFNDGNGEYAGHVRIYEWSGTNWIQKGIDIDGEAENDVSGASVSLSSDGFTVAIGAPGNGGNGEGAGHVRIYEWSGTNWIQKGIDIDGEAAGDGSGRSVSLSSDGFTVAIGAGGNDGNGENAGHVRIYEWNGSVWTQKGMDIDGEAAGDGEQVQVSWSGVSVSLNSDGNTVAIGAPGNDGNGSKAGHARIYEWNGSAWTQKGIDIDGEEHYQLGGSVSLSSDGNTVAIGAAENNMGFIGNGPGQVRIYEWNGSAWIQKGIDIVGEAPKDWSGGSVSLSSDGNTVAIGAVRNDGIGFHQAGHVRIYSYDCTIDVSLTDSSSTLSANQTGATYQWLDCNNGNTAIIGETSQSFTATANGSYAVEISIFGCVDTSECFPIIVDGIIENDIGSDLVFYPNPTFDYLNIELGTLYSNIYAKVISINGQVVKSKEFFNTDRINLMIEGLPGYYIVEIITSNSKRAAIGIIKE